MECISCRTPLILHRELCICSHTHQPYCSCCLLSDFQCKNKLPHCPMYSGYMPPGVTDLSQGFTWTPERHCIAFVAAAWKWSDGDEQSAFIPDRANSKTTGSLNDLQAHISLRFHKTSSLWIHSKRVTWNSNTFSAEGTSCFQVAPAFFLSQGVWEHETFLSSFWEYPSQISLGDS